MGKGAAMQPDLLEEPGIERTGIQELDVHHLWLDIQ